MGFERVNAVIKKWGEERLAAAKKNGVDMNITHLSRSPSPTDSLQSMQVKFSKRADDIINAVVFTLSRTLFYVFHGAGKGYGGAKGSTWKTRDGEKKRTSSASLGKAGNAPRVAKRFLDTIDDGSQEFLDEVAAATMDTIFTEAFNQ